MANNLVPFYLPRVYFFQSATQPNDYFVLVFIDMYPGPEFGPWIMPLDAEIVKDSNGDLSINYGTINTSPLAGESLSTFYSKLFYYENMRTTPFPTVTFNPEGSAKSSGKTIQNKPNHLTEDQCRTFVAFSSTLGNVPNTGPLCLVGCLVDVQGNQELGNAVTNMSPGNGASPTLQVMLYTNSDSSDEGGALYTKPFIIGPINVGYVTDMQLVDPNGFPVAKFPTSTPFNFNIPPAISL